MLGFFMAHIGDEIRLRRKEFGLTQAQLAELSGVNINTLTKIERGEGNPTIGLVKKVLETLGLELTTKTIDV